MIIYLENNANLEVGFAGQRVEHVTDDYFLALRLYDGYYNVGVGLGFKSAVELYEHLGAMIEAKKEHDKKKEEDSWDEKMQEYLRLEKELRENGRLK